MENIPDVKKISEKERRTYAFALMKQQEAQKQQKREDAAEYLKAGNIPTAPEIIEAINSSISQRNKVLSNHIFWREMKIREGLKSLINVALSSYVDICRHDAALVGLGQNYDVFHEQAEHMVSNPLQKDVMAFCAAVHGCIDTVRRLKKCRTDIFSQIDCAIDKHLSGDVFDFIKSLRKNLSHGSVVIPSWRLSKDKNGLSGNMVLNINDLLSFGEWSSGAKRYIQSSGNEKVNIADAIGKYNEGLTKFSKSIDDILARSVTEAEKDYYNIQDSYKRTASGQWMKVMASQIGKDKDPYDFLHRFFKPEEVREIMRKPKHSREQVDYIISLRSIETACDNELRNVLYKLFGVEFTKPAAPDISHIA